MTAYIIRACLTCGTKQQVEVKDYLKPWCKCDAPKQAPDDRSVRMIAIAQALEDEGQYVKAGSVAAVTMERDALRAECARLRAERDTLRRSHDLLSPDMPEGFETVLGYIAIYHPAMLDVMDCSDPQATQRDGCWLMHHATDRRVVVAPAVLRACGIDVVNAWPLADLARCFARG